MSREAFSISDVNPNDAVGGGGCICSPAKVEDCKPPYAIFFASETDSNLSPHVVACEKCLRAATAAIDRGEVLSAGERDPSDDDYDEAGAGEADHGVAETFQPGDIEIVYVGATSDEGEIPDV